MFSCAFLECQRGAQGTDECHNFRKIDTLSYYRLIEFLSEKNFSNPTFWNFHLKIKKIQPFREIFRKKTFLIELRWEEFLK